ncbi:hypothetical protein [Paraflavitalea sp. CAU 1676]|uniref:hypothetical protein n=1 Tax=Paraflavitalea sp. CAU 1676 TaxID=3032598 RepID=UPI0023D97931|nr:hypothetical protein [Paraflavitalea sp. CAU 1676]MDF2188018.1 hypothetical protein [Paraflavitalea sp. CAU 1676]
MSPTLQRLHRITGIVIASFLLLHVTNHLFALAGPATHIAVMKVFRRVYRFPPVEILLLACVAFQVVSGLILVFKKGFRKQPAFVMAQVISGLYLSFFLCFHVRAVLMGRYSWKVETDFYFAAGVANSYPGKLFFIPYYTLSLLAAFTHFAAVHYYKRRGHLAQITDEVAHAAADRRYKRETLAIGIAGSVITLLIMLALSGVLYPI